MYIIDILLKFFNIYVIIMLLFYVWYVFKFDIDLKICIF